jgi:predicted RNA-binding Zn ribbon-like protein
VAFEFHAGRLVLDFAATIAERATTNLEKLQRPADLGAWAVASGRVSGPPAVTPRQLEAAIALREALYRLLDATLDGAAQRPEDRELVNAVARGTRSVPQLSAHGQVVRTGTVEAVLADIACDCLDLLGGEDLARLRRCADPKCTRLFIDRSRGGRRRWCDMKGCGDRAKAAAYRRRRQGSASSVGTP